MKLLTYGGFFRALCNDTRLSIITSLEKGPKCVSEIVKETKLEQSRVSHNLQCLERNGFVKVKRDGKQRVYTLNKDTISPILKAIHTHIKKYGLETC